MSEITELWTVETRASDADTWTVAAIRYNETEALDTATRYRSGDVKTRARRFVPADRAAHAKETER